MKQDKYELYKMIKHDRIVYSSGAVYELEWTIWQENEWRAVAADINWHYVREYRSQFLTELIMILIRNEKDLH